MVRDEICIFREERKNMSGNEKSRPADDYSDIIDLPHHTSSRHPRMAAEMRAAQFAPFAALAGYEETIEETALRQQAEVMARDRMKE
jgi:hypothetical protein